MHTDISHLPNEILSYTFYFLDEKELNKVATVSKKWSKVQETESLWQKHCLVYLCDAQPYKGSWKERFKIIYNWLHASPEIHSYLPFSEPCRSYGSINFRRPNHNPNHDFTILDDNTPIEVCYPDSGDHLIIRNIAADKTITIDLKPFNITQAIARHLEGKIYMVLSSQSKVFYFDCQTGESIKNIVLQQMQEMLSIERSMMSLERFLMNEDKIMTFNSEELIILKKEDDESKLKIWNTHTGQLEHILTLPNLHSSYLSHVHSLPHFIIYTAKELHVDKLTTIAIRKDNQFNFIKEWTEGEVFFSSGPYLVSLTELGEVNIFKDSPEDLILTLTISANEAELKNSNGECTYKSVRIYQNWLFIEKGDEIKIWDLLTGKHLSTLPTMQIKSATCKKSSFCTNGIQLLFQNILWDDSSSWTFPSLSHHYSAYHFGDKVTPLNLTYKQITLPPKQIRCSVM